MVEGLPNQVDNLWEIQLGKILGPNLPRNFQGISWHKSFQVVNLLLFEGINNNLLSIVATYFKFFMLVALQRVALDERLDYPSRCAVFSIDRNISVEKSNIKIQN